jgi:hypothetical protein
MDEKKYYEISSQKKLLNRCPILEKCSRRADTIYQFSEYDHDKTFSDTDGFDVLIRLGILPKNFRENQINIQGERPFLIRGKDHYYFSNVCPEVNLFDGENALSPKTACVEGGYDKHYNDPKSRVIKCQHYSECPEYSHYIFHQNLKVGTKKKRKYISQKVKATLQQEIHSKCPFCVSTEVGHFEVHHIDGNPENNDYMNLLMVCPTCHSKITKQDITMDCVIEVKLNCQGYNNE